jgi:endonuclease/exonuclease/phosphatase family metal-dependent hydrolase
VTTLLAGAVGTVLGLQALRAFFPLLLYVLKDRAGQPSPVLGVEAVALFASAFLAPRLVRGRRGMLRALVVLAVLRGALQTWNGDPAVSLALAAACVPAFLAFLAAPAADRARGFLLGALLDVSSHALAGTRDLHWGGDASDAAAGALVGLALFAALAERRRRGADDADDSPTPATGLLAWGPFLLLHLELLGNVARHSARTGLPTALTGALVGAGLAVAALIGPRIVRAGAARGGGLPLLGTAFLVPAVLRWDAAGPAAIPLLAAAQLAASALLLRALAPGEPTGGDPASGRRGAFLGLGSVLLIGLLFLHYAGYDLPLPLGRGATLLAAALALGVAALGPRTGAARAAPAHPGVSVAAAALVLLPLARGVPSAPVPEPDPDGTVVVSFNLHAGFDERGGWAFDRMMRELRATHPDVVALQEVSRGWVVNGGADLFELARESLGFRGVHGPTVSTDWGSAVFARAGIESARTVPLPPRDLALSRAFTIVELAAGSFPRRVVATHFHHRAEDDALRELQARVLADSVPATPDAILAGDFNARPESGAMALLRDAGWLDAAGPPEIARRAPTFPSAAPARRIDAILAGDPSRVAACDVAPPWGSDHRAVVARFRP